MNKSGQEIINERAEQLFKSAINELGVCALCGLEGKRLRSCQAEELLHSSKLQHVCSGHQ